MPREYLFKHWDKLKENFIGRDVFLFLDFDGTLSPIASTPDEATLPKENKLLLEKLVKIKRCRVAIVSGRALADVRHHVLLKDLIYVGNHGFEIAGQDISFESICSPEVNSVLDRIKSELAVNFSKIKGALIEDKGLTISLHYRLVSPEEVPLVQKTFEKVCKPFEQKKEIVVFAGKKVLEIRPPILWNKGAAVMWLLQKYKIPLGKNSPCIYIGDDTTDEDAFNSLQGIGVTVLVGGNESVKSKAGYYLNNTHEVTSFLTKLAELVEGSVSQINR